MVGPLKLGNLWKVIRDVDLDAIRGASQRRFSLAFVSADGVGARRAASLISLGLDHPPHPWCAIYTAAEGVTIPTASVAAVLIATDESLGDALRGVREHCVRDNIPVCVLIVADSAPAFDAARESERVRAHVTALEGSAASTLALAIHDAVSAETRLALATALPGMRRVVCDTLIEETARANASFALTTGLAETIPLLTAPLILGDIVVLTKNQLILSYRIALIHGHGRDGDPRKLIAEILGVLGGGLLFRQAARQLMGLIPVIGIAPKVAIAYGGTWAIGHAMTAWASDGRAVTGDAVRRYSAEGLERGRSVAKRIVDGAQQAGAKTKGRWDRLKRELPFLRRR